MTDGVEFSFFIVSVFVPTQLLVEVIICLLVSSDFYGIHTFSSHVKSMSSSNSLPKTMNFPKFVPDFFKYLTCEDCSSMYMVSLCSLLFKPRNRTFNLILCITLFIFSGNSSKVL